MQKTLNFIVGNEELSQRLTKAGSFEEVYALFKSVKSDITEEEFESFFIDFFKEIENYSKEDMQKLLGVESLDKENLEKISGGKISHRVMSAALASLVLAPSVRATSSSSIPVNAQTGATSSAKASNASEKDKSIKDKLSKKFSKLKDWFYSLPLWEKIAIPGGVASVPIIGTIICKLWPTKAQNTVTDTIEQPEPVGDPEPNGEITTETVKSKIEELLNSESTSVDDNMPVLFQQVKEKELQTDVYNIIDQWLKNGQGDYDTGRSSNKNAKTMVIYFANNLEDGEVKNKFVELKEKLEKPKTPDSPTPNPESSDNQAEEENKASPKQGPESSKQAIKAVDDKSEMITENNAWDKISKLLTTEEISNPDSEEKYLADVRILCDKIGNDGQPNKIMKKVYDDLERWFKNEEGDYDLEKITDARARYIVDYLSNQGDDEAFKNKYRELDSKLNQTILVEKIAKSARDYKTDTTNDTARAAVRLVKALALARLGEIKFVARQDTKDSNEKSGREFDDFKDYEGYLTDLFAYGNTVVFDCNKNVTQKASDVGKLIDPNYEEGGGSEWSYHNLELDRDNRVYETKGGQLSKAAGKLTGTAIGSTLPIDIISGQNVEPHMVTGLLSKLGMGNTQDKPYKAPNTLKTLATELSDNKAGFFAKLEPCMDQTTSRYGHKHSTNGQSNIISATAAIREFSPFALRDAIKITFDKFNLEEIKHAIDNWYEKFAKMDLKEQKSTLYELTNPIPHTELIAKQKEFFKDVNYVFDRDEVAVKQANVLRIMLNDRVNLVVFKYPKDLYSFWLEVNDDTSIDELGLNDFVKKALNVRISESQMQQVLEILKNNPNFSLDKKLTLTSISNNSQLYIGGYSELISEEYKDQEKNAEKLKKLYSDSFKSVLRKSESGFAGRTLYSFEFSDLFYKKHEGKTVTSDWETCCDWATDGLKELIRLTEENKDFLGLNDEYIKKLSAEKTKCVFISWKEVFDDSKEWYLLNQSTPGEKADTIALLTDFSPEVQNEILGFINNNSSGGHIHSEQGTSGVANKIHPKKVEISEGSSRKINHPKYDDEFNWNNLSDRSVKEMMIRRIFYFKTGINLPNRVGLSKSWSDTMSGFGASAIKGVAKGAKALGKWFFGGENK